MIRIITDSAADLTAQDLAQPGVAVVPMCVTFADDTTVEDGRVLHAPCQRPQTAAYQPAQPGRLYGGVRRR